MQLTLPEMIDAALIVRCTRSSFSIYEPVCQNFLGYRSMTCPFANGTCNTFFQRNKDICGNTKEMENLSNFMCNVSKIYSCSLFFRKDKSAILAIADGWGVTEAMGYMLFLVNTLVPSLKRSPVKMRRSIRFLLGALSLQLEHSFLPLAKSLSITRLLNIFEENEEFDRGGDEGIISQAEIRFDNFVRDLGLVETLIKSISHICNFVPLEETLNILEKKGSDLFKNEINLTLSILRSKYPYIIESKKLEIKFLIKKMRKIKVLIKKMKKIKDGDVGNFEQKLVSLYDMNMLLIKLRSDVRELSFRLHIKYKIQ